MRYSSQIKPISYIKSHTAEVLDKLTEEFGNQSSLPKTAKLVQFWWMFATYEQTEESDGAAADSRSR